MASITIRKLDDRLKAGLRVRAARRGHFIEEEAREPASQRKGLGAAIREIFEPLGGVELEIPPRAATREPPGFGK